MEFKELKLKSVAQELSRLRRHIRFDINIHKKTKLKVLGTRARSTLLDSGVSKTHADRLQKQFLARWKGLRKREWTERLRLWTVLDSIAPLDEESIMQSIKGLQARLVDVCSKVKGIEVIGVIEIEVVNIAKMRELAKEADEARKLNVLSDLLPKSEKGLFKDGVESFALVHFHGVVDLGMDADEKHQTLSDKSRYFWDHSYQVELKKLHADKTIGKNLANIAKYLVKGGNENLIYKIGFGYDTAEKLETQMLKAGKKKLGADFDGFVNEMSLTMEEVRVLGTALDKLMGSKGSKNLRNGYLWKSGQRVTWFRRRI